MKKWLLLSLLFAGAAFAEVKNVGPAGATTQTANHASANIPSAATDGLPLLNQCGVTVILAAASGQTLSGAGTLVFWYYDTGLARWIPNAEANYTVTTSGRRDIVLKSRPVKVGYGRVYVEALSVTSSSGALTIRLVTGACED